MTEETSELLEELRWRGKQGFTRHTMSFQLSIVQVRVGATSLHRRMPKSMQHCIHGNMFVGVWTCTVHPLAMHNNCKNAVAVVGVIHFCPSCQVVVHVHTFWQSHVGQNISVAIWGLRQDTFVSHLVQSGDCQLGLAWISQAMLDALGIDPVQLCRRNPIRHCF